MKTPQTPRSNSPYTRAIALLSATLLLMSGCASDTDSHADDSQPDADADNIEEVRSSESRITNPSTSSSGVETLTEDNAEFAYDLYDEIKQSESGNFFYSPHSISSALAMTYAGAEGTSESEMKSALEFTQPEADLHPAFNRLDLTLEQRANQSGNSKSGSPFDLNIANSIWGQRGFDFKQPFLDTLAKHYGAGLRVLNFQEQPDAARNTINRWVENQTDDNIKDLMPKSSITPDTRLVLTNAIYFKASWAHKFDENQTRQAQFNTLSGQNVSVDMMSLRQQNGLAYTAGSNWQAVELPYVGDEVSMVLIVPDAGAFNQVEQQLSGTWINSIFDDLSGEPVDLDMPKFDIETKFSVKKMLQALGMEQPFAPGAANFSGMADDPRLFIQDAIHQSFVSVDEKGTEAAAATGVSMGVTSVPKYKSLTIDRPFIFAIHDRQSDAVIFTGRVTDPS